MLGQRALSSVFIVTAAVIPAVLGHPILTFGLVVLAIAGIREFNRAVTGNTPARPLTALPLVVSSALILAIGFDLSWHLIAGVIVLGMISILIGRILRNEIVGATQDWAMSLAPLIYISVPLAHVPLVRNIDGDISAGWFESIGNWSLGNEPSAGLAWLVFIVTITWLTDTGAYFGGRFFGRRKLAPALSPGKTVEGGIGGLIMGALAGLLLIWLLGLPVPIYVGLLMGIVLSAAGQIGDLAESLFKRDLGIKDMGTIIPGHGGILDRIDALLFTIPFGFYLILLAQEINWP